MRPVRLTCIFVWSCSLIAACPRQGSAANWTTLDYPGSTYTSITGVDGSNVVGYYQVGSGTVYHGFCYNGSTFTTLDDPLVVTSGSQVGTFVQGISGASIVGYYTNSTANSGVENHGFLYDGTNYNPIDYPSSTQSWAFGISGGTIVGEYFDFHGFKYQGGNYTTLDDPQATIGTAPQGVSGNNVVGISIHSDGLHGFLFNGTTWTTLDDPIANSHTTRPHGIGGNNIVGEYLDNSPGTHGFIFDGVTYSSLDYPGANSTVANGVSGSTIVGRYADSSGVTHGFIATVPEPSSIVLAAFGILSIAALKFRRPR